jgi:hypothetical protein
MLKFYRLRERGVSVLVKQQREEISEVGAHIFNTIFRYKDKYKFTDKHLLQTSYLNISGG